MWHLQQGFFGENENRWLDYRDSPRQPRGDLLCHYPDAENPSVAPMPWPSADNGAGVDLRMLTRKIPSKLLHWGRYLTNWSTRVPGTSEKSVIPLEFIATFLPKAPIVVEAGAYNGSDTRRMSELWPKGTIYAFEPLPQLFRRLLNKTRRLKNVRCFPLALSDKTGATKMFVSSGASEASSSLMAPKEHLTEHQNVLFETEVDVETITLDEWAEKNGVKKVDFMWLDMQGHELRTLKVAFRILSTVGAIYTEVSLRELYEGSPLYSEVREWLEGEGFRVEIEDIPWPDGGNVLFVRHTRQSHNCQNSLAVCL